MKKVIYGWTLDKILDKKGFGQREFARIVTEAYKEEYPDVWVDPKTGLPREKPDWEKGFRYTTVNDICKHRATQPHIDNLAKICSVLECELTDIIKTISFDDFSAWCKENGFEPVPVNQQIVGKYIDANNQ
jgi:hypothetical protein